MQEIAGEAIFIPDFKWALNFVCLDGKNVGDSLVSPDFKFLKTSEQGDSTSTWKLILYPKGNTEKNQNFLSLFIVNLSPFGVTASVQFSHSYQGSTSKCLHIDNNYFPPKPDGRMGKSIGFSRYCEVHLFKRFIKNKNFAIKCRLEIHTIHKEENLDAHLALGESSDAGNVEVVDLSESMDYIEKLLTNRAFSDVTISAQEKSFHLHKCILSTRSSVFEAIFKKDLIANKPRVVEINNFSSNVLQELFRFIYVGKVCVSVSEDAVGDLLACAEAYGVDGLKKLCEDQMCRKLNNGNAINYYNIAVQSQAKNLETHAIDYIGRHLGHFVNRAEFRQFSLAHPEVSFNITKKYVNSKNQL